MSSPSRHEQAYKKRLFALDGLEGESLNRLVTITIPLGFISRFGQQIYLAFVFCALVAAAILGDSLQASKTLIVHHSDLVTLIVATLLVGLLLPLVQREIIYSLGLAFLLVAIATFYLASPYGVTWATEILSVPNFGAVTARALGFISLIAFPLGWVFLAGSLRRWIEGLIAYIAVGSSLVAILSLTFGTIPPSQSIRLVLFWPHFLLRMFGVFGWTLN